MDVREKYVVQKVNRKEKSICPNCIHHNLCIAENNQPCFECNRFINTHGVTVQEGKPLEAFLHPIDTYSGLKAKYLVFKADTGEKVDNCFILRPDKDPAAEEALRSYASATDNETLAEDIYNWVGKGEPVQEWISVKDRLPDNKEHDWVLAQVVEDNGFLHIPKVMEYRQQRNDWFEETYGWLSEHNGAFTVTHWMPLPQPPKGE